MVTHNSKTTIWSLWITFFILCNIVLFSCENSGINGDNNKENTVILGNNNIVISDSKNKICDSAEIVGKWNKEKASELMLSLLNQNFDSISNNYSHRIVDFYDMDYGDKEIIIGVGYSRDKIEYDDSGNDVSDGSCHACTVEMSFVEFVKYANGWKIENKYLRNLTTGSWGTPPEWKLINIGYHKFGFLEEGGFMNMGEAQTYGRLFAFVAGEFKELLAYDAGYSGSGSSYKEISETNYDTNVDVIKEGTGFYDLVIVTKGTKKGIPFSEKNYYKFDGIGYSISNSFK